VELELPLLPGDASPFDLAAVVRNHGLLMIAPNRWDPAAHALVRPLRVTFYHSASLLARVSAQPTRPGTVLLVAAQPVEDEYSLPAVSIPVNVKASRRTEVRARPAATMDPRVG
jgi:hypothetical protein